MMRRVVILGRGAEGMSTAAVALGQRSGLPVIELDKHFWRPGTTPTPTTEWTRKQTEPHRPRQLDTRRLSRTLRRLANSPGRGGHNDRARFLATALRPESCQTSTRALTCAL